MNEGGALQMCAKSTGLSDGWSALGNYEGSIHTVDFFRHLFMDPYPPRAIILCQPRINRTWGSDSHTNDQLGLLTLIDSLGVEPWGIPVQVNTLSSWHWNYPKLSVVWVHRGQLPRDLRPARIPSAACHTPNEAVPCHMYLGIWYEPHVNESEPDG